MNEPWFNAAYFAWIPGTLLGVCGGLWGTLVGVLGPMGKGKSWMIAMGWGMLAACAVLLLAGLAALLAGQPYGIWYGLGFQGLLGLFIVGGLLPVVKKTYQLAEQRRMNAQDL
ncbi:MAG: hypothetical protein AB7O62_17950 [Pirellulales bacterium]